MKLKPNIGAADKIVRLLLAIILIIIVYTDVLSDIFDAVGLILALYLTTTSLVDFCPLYKLLKFNSIKEKNETNK